MMALYALAAVAGSVAATASFHSLAGAQLMCCCLCCSCSEHRGNHLFAHAYSVMEGADAKHPRLLAGPTINLVLNLTGASLFQVVAIASAIALAAAMLAAALPSGSQ